MLRLNDLSLVQFKNYQNSQFHFTGRVTGITGKNGIGKTNLLDAIHYLCFTKSYFTRLDAQNILQGCEGFRLEGEFNRGDKEEKAVCTLRETGKKEFSLDNTLYDRFSHHIGHFPCVIIAPDDISIVTGASDERRRFVDTLQSQLDADYLQLLITYNKILQQRNSLLRSFADAPGSNLPLLAVLDEQLQKPAKTIFEKRREFLVSFLPQANRLYNDIAKQPGQNESPGEKITLNYSSELFLTPYPELLKMNRTRDRIAMRTMSGIHRDDLEFSLNDQPFRNIASQGQRKTLLFALKLAEMEALRKANGFSPLLLLDDVFEKLDEERIRNLLQRVCIENDGQVFITDTNTERLRQHLDDTRIAYRLIDLGRQTLNS